MKYHYLVLLALLVTFKSTAIAHQGPYYDRREGAEIAQCIRTNMVNAPAPSPKDLQLDEDWMCQQILYLWGDDFHLDILVVRDDYNAPIFHFVQGPYSNTDEVVDNAAAQDKGKSRYGFFAHKYLKGFFSYKALGPGPHRQDYLTFRGGYLLWEESVENLTFNIAIPALLERPIALYDNYPDMPETWKRRATIYGVCRRKSMPAKDGLCFSRDK